MATLEERMKMKFDEYKVRVSERFPHISIVDKEYVGSDYKMTFRCDIDNFEFKKDIGAILLSPHGCPMCSKRNRKVSKGSEHPSWNGGVTDISSYLRRSTDKWKRKALKKHKVCDISGVGYNLEVHHMMPSFWHIRDKAFKNTGIDMRESVSEYTKEELKMLLKECERLHESSAYVVLNRFIHKEYHSKYGYPEYGIAEYTRFKADFMREFKVHGDSEKNIKDIKRRIENYISKLSYEQELEEKYSALPNLRKKIAGKFDKIDTTIRESIEENMITKNNFYGKLYGVRAEDFYSCMNKNLKTCDERIEHVNKVLYPDGKLHPYWEEVFDQDNHNGKIKICIDSSDTIYSESNIAAVLSNIASYILEPIIDDDKTEYKIISDYKMFKDELKSLSYEYVTDENNRDVFNVENYMVFYKDEFKNFKKDNKQVINKSDYNDPEIGKELSDYKRVSDYVTLKRNFIREVRDLTESQLEEIDDLYRAYVEDSHMGMPKTEIWDRYLEIVNGSGE